VVEWLHKLMEKGRNIKKYYTGGEIVIFCTLFDSHYLDKGLVMYDSLSDVSDDFKLYVIAFDDKCYEVLIQLNKLNLIPIRMSDFESKELLSVKNDRTRGEYCWTCSSHAIAYVLDNYEDSCTYIDADMYFYEKPDQLYEEMIKSDCQVQIIEQRFDNRVLSRQMMKRSGKYCVEFNTFTNDVNSRKILRWWQDRVLECCTVSADGKIFGDQKYLDDWTERFKGVHVVENLGAGVAPWNITNYELISKEDDKTELLYSLTGDRVSLIFYHFHNMTFMDANRVNIEVFNRASSTSKELVWYIYYPYIKKIIEKRNWLSQKYQIDYSIKEKHPTSIASIIKDFSIKEVFGKLRGYNIIGLAQFVWYQKNHKYDIIDISKIPS
jgi:hypothetical protein